MQSAQQEGPAFLHSARPRVDTACIVRVLRDHWGIEGTSRDLGGDRDQNLVIDGTDGNRYLVKIAQSGEDPGVIDLQLAALEHIAARDPALPVPRVIRTRDNARTFALPAEDGVNLFRIFNHLPGRPVIEEARTGSLMHSIGTLLARVDRALQGFFHPHAGHELLWDIRQAPAIRKYADDVDDPALRERIRRTLDHFIEEVLPALAGLPAQVIHGDATAENVLGDGNARASGLIDFGDIVHAPRCQEVAIAMADVTRDLADPWAAACTLAAGYDEVSPLDDEEIEPLWDMCCARLALTLAIMESRAKFRDEGLGSMAESVTSCQRQFETLLDLGAGGAGRRLRRALRAPQVAVPDRDELLQRRQRRLLPGLALFYPEDPLHVVRGEGVWLIDAAGERHLDCYNNVPQVGHAHPHVTHAIARQTATLNTNTRYIYDSIVEYADALAERLPGDLGVALFVNSGSEANDLAWQIARAYTGASGALVTARAYHGGTVATDALSPQDHVKLPNHIARLPVASAHNGDGEREARSAIAALANRGHDPAAFMIDPALASDGILDPPPAWFDGTTAAVRAAGGLCIADEVQSGFGRLGRWWGFEARGFTPDIVTLGKPVANGYPMGVVVTTPRIMDAFAHNTDYFSTFGGNPVACMAGLAVIDVIEREALCQQADEVGTYLRTRLSELQSRHATTMADVRGRGLFVGVELVGEGMARTVALDLRRRGVLVGVEGAKANVLKIRPPLVFRNEHADILVDALAATLRGIDA